MGIGLNDTIRQGRGQVILSAIDAGSGPGVLKLYTAPQPAKGVVITSQTLLGVLTFADPCGTNTAGVSTLTLNSDPAADANGEVAWGRITDSAGGFVADMPATLLAGAGPIRMPSLTVYAGGLINVASVTLTEGDA